MPDEKWCPDCSETRPSSQFYPRKDAKDGLTTRCRECTRIRNGANRAARRDQYLKYDRERYKRPARKEYIKNLYAGRRDERRAYQKAYYEERKSEWQLKYRTKNKNAMYSAARRAQQRANGSFTVIERDWRRLVARYRGLCGYCHQRPWEHRDHIIPIAKGGQHSIGNLMPACAECNFAKKAMLPVMFRMIFS